MSRVNKLIISSLCAVTFLLSLARLVIGPFDPDILTIMALSFVGMLGWLRTL